jgi:hypothetical protein
MTGFIVGFALAMSFTQFVMLAISEAREQRGVVVLAGEAAVCAVAFGVLVAHV